MTSSGSPKDLAKAISSFLQKPVLPLPDELHAVIGSYLSKQQGVDSAAADRLNDELLSIYEKVVQGRPDKYAAFLVVLQELHPALQTPARVFEWWDKLLDPVLEAVSQERGLAREVLNHTLALLSMEEGHDPANWSVAGSAPFMDRLLARFLEVTRTAEKDELTWIPADNLKATMINEALMVFGKNDPKGFMTALNNLLIKKDNRLYILTLLCRFIFHQPPHLHLILQTPLFVNLLQSLQKDTSADVLAMALSALMMIMPHIPSSLVPFLPTLFNIYARLLFWDKNSGYSLEHNENPGMAVEDEGGWEKVVSTPDEERLSIDRLSIYFTYLYGLYPINFLDYIRKPQRYLRHANNAEDIDVQAMEIRDRSDRFRKTHLLHPNFYSLTIETEKSDLSRWLKSEAEEVVFNCWELSVDPPDPPAKRPARVVEPKEVPVPGMSSEAADPDGTDPALLGGSANEDALPQQNVTAEPHAGSRATSNTGRRDSQSSHHPSACESLDPRTREVGGDSPTLPPHLIQSSSQLQVQDTARSNTATRSSLQQLQGNDSVPSLALSAQNVAVEKSPSQPSIAQPSRNQDSTEAEPSDQSARFNHQRLLLLNDLQFERYLKKQHMIHMGELRRKQVRQAATEAETQNVVMANRSLRQRLDEAKRSEAQVKKEFDHRRNITQKRENDLSAKLRTLREEQKKWSTEGSTLRQQLEAAHVECERLRRIVDETEKRRLESEQNLEALDISADEIQRLRTEIARLSVLERAFQGRELTMQCAMQEAEVAKNKAEQLEIELAAREDELMRLRLQYEDRIRDMDTKLSKTLEDTQGKRAREAAAHFESALAASRAKQSELQKQYNTLQKSYTVLQSTLLDYQCVSSEARSVGNSNEVEPEPLPPRGGSPVSVRRIPIRGFADTEIMDGTSHNATPPLEPLPGPSGFGPQRPSTPKATFDVAGKTSPQAERYFGRGGLQNVKTRKDKKEDKKDKKSGGTGLRGLRSLV
ncbi:Hamartin protein-domain-containing protein [Podospora didyma]|uniref:Hamartin protein-domain-containing protein n=1 Tax=Podospora didyma TaxID=330526 RepID=A0AAE0U587_9PEZI|nr:Hamartin protein-domain-containing protein [Podospora didyma]